MGINCQLENYELRVFALAWNGRKCQGPAPENEETDEKVDCAGRFQFTKKSAIIGP